MRAMAFSTQWTVLTGISGYRTTLRQRQKKSAKLGSHSNSRNDYTLAHNPHNKDHLTAKTAIILSLLSVDAAAQIVPFSSHKTTLKSGCCSSMYQPVFFNDRRAAPGIDKWASSPTVSSLLT